MSPDPGSVDETPTMVPTSPQTTATSAPATNTNSIARSTTSRRQRTVGSDGSSPLDEPPDLPGSSSSGTLNNLASPVAPNPRRHRQRLASHYLSQIRQSQQPSSSSGHRTSTSTIPFHHYYHPYHQHHHRHLHYPSFPHGFYTRAPTANTGLQMRTRNRQNDRSPFLMVKILLFSLMTIDFVMNTIGLAVIVVMAKNHYNNLAVERSLHPPPLDKSLPPPEDPYRNVYNHPNMGNEWTIIMPLLPSFIFVEILTLVGMFGVFCDLFSFTMTYAILKLITSLCYPSMASAAAVAAMATATTTTTTISGGSGGIGSMTPGVAASNVAPGSTFLLPPLPDNLTALLNHARTMNLSSSGFVNPAENMVMESTVDPTTTIPPVTWTPNWLPTSVPLQDNTSSTLQSSLPPTTTSTVTPLTTVTSSSATNTINPGDTSKNYKHNRLKHDKLMAQMKQLKKTEKMAKLKQREKQLRTKLLRMESAESSLSNWTSSPSSHARISMIIPPGSNIDNSSFHSHHSNIKYHHRVWDALLVTFEVIFAVAFAFNTLTNSARREMTEDGYYSDEEEESGGGGDRRHRRIRRFRSLRGYQWPYSPLANSIDAFYFAQFQLPPPPPPYFGAAQNQRSSPQRSVSARPNPTTAGVTSQTRPIRSHRSLLDSNQWRRLTPSWLRNADTSHAQPPPPPSRSPSIRSLPPLYEEIDRDMVIVAGNVQELAQPSNTTPSVNTPERIVLQVITHEHEHQIAAVLEPPESTEPLTESIAPESPKPLKTKTDNVTNIQITGSDQIEPSNTTESANNNPNKTLVITINDTRV